jgi:hypothetical protein
MFMKNTVLMLLISILINGYGMAQSPQKDPYAFRLNGKEIKAEANAGKTIKTYRAKAKSNSLSSGNHFIIQFKTLPTVKEQARLKKSGVCLLNYISGNAYFATIEPSFFLAKSSSSNLRSIIEIQPEYKISERLTSGSVPDYAKDASGRIKVVITYFDKTDKAQIESDLKNLKVLQPNIFAQFRQVEASVASSDLLKLASLSWVQNIEMVAPPMQLDNRDNRTSQKVNILTSNLKGLGYGLTGKDVRVGLWDGDVDHHRDFGNRVITREYEMHTTDHGTHTCGTLAGAGLLDPLALGMAPEATVYAWNFNSQSNGLNNAQERLWSLENDGIELTSNSFGYSLKSCPNEYTYNSSDRSEDYLAMVFPYFLYVYSAGNNQDVCPDGYRTSTKNIKNSLVVANVDNLDSINWSSSFGPTFDGRLVPNISGVGTDVYSTFLDNTYGYMTGTSMATPAVAGTMTLIYQRYKETHGGARPISALMRALACNTAHDLGNPGPDYKYGYGIINGARAVKAMEQKYYFTDSVGQGDVVKKDITIPNGAVGLRVMLSWTDMYGTPGASTVLVNDLDLKVLSGSTEILPWVLNPENPSASATRGVDKLNNLEQVTIDNPKAGTYTIEVSGSAVPADKQEFAIVYDIVMPELSLTYPIGGESFSEGASEVISWDYEGSATAFNIEYSSDNGLTYNAIASNIPSNVRRYEWLVPANQSVAKAKIRVSTANAFSESKESFSIMTAPKSVSISEGKCGTDSYSIKWSEVENAVYKVYKLKGQAYEFLGDATTNSYELTGLSLSNDNYFCVRAIDKTTGAISERSVAATVNPVASYSSKAAFKEDFSDQKADNFFFESNNGKASIKYVNTDQTYGLRLEGPSTEIETAWDASASTYEEVFTKNPEYIVKSGVCNFDASAFTGKKLMLSFDYRQKYTEPGACAFRVKVNGNIVANIEGTEIYDGENAQSYQTVNYDLSSYAGNASVKVEFEAVCKTAYVTYLNKNGDYDFSDDALDKGDFVAIDNVFIGEPSLDVAVNEVFVSTDAAHTGTVTVAVKNQTLSSISNIPVSYKVDDNKAVSETITETVAPFATVTYNFTQKFDLSAEGRYSVVAYTNLTNDTVKTNDTLSTVKIVDPSTKIGESKGTIITDNAVFTDIGGKYDAYTNNRSDTITFKPATDGKASKVTFSEFASETDYDFLYVYDGPNVESTLLGSYTGTNIPPAFISSAIGGELTFVFVADPYVNDLGWVAKVESVNKPAVDASVTEVLFPTTSSSFKTNAEEVQIKVVNKGTNAISSFDAYYQIDGKAPVKETFTTGIASGESAYVSFATKADLSVPGEYAVKTWVKAADDAITTNDTLLYTVTCDSKLEDVSISLIYTTYPYRTKKTTLNAIVKNVGNVEASNFEVAYKINDGVEIRRNITGPIAPGATKSFAFYDLDLTAVNTYKIAVYSILKTDANATNDTLVYTFKVANPSATNVAGYFDGSSTAVSAPGIPETNLINNYTVELWAKLEKTSTFGRLFDKSYVTMFYQSHYSSVYPDNSMILNVTTNGGAFTYYYPGVLENLIGSWHHYALTVSASNVYTFYIDGVAQTPTVYSGTAAATKDNLYKTLAIGNKVDLGRGVTGAIDEVRIWNSCLDQATIVANTTTDYATNTSGLQAYYKFKEGSGRYLFDYSANDNTAVIVGNGVSKTEAGDFWIAPGALLQDFYVTGEKIPTSYDEASNTFTTVLDNADLSHVTPNFTAVQNSVVKIGNDVQTSGTEKDFSAGTVTYTVEGVGFNAGISQTYKVNISNDLASDCELTAFSFEQANNAMPQLVLDKTGDKFYKKFVGSYDITALKGSFAISKGAKLYIDNALQTNSLTTALDCSKPVLVKVVSENGRFFKNYIIDIDKRSNLCTFENFSLTENQVGTAAINYTDKTIVVYLNKEAGLEMLTPLFTISPNAKAYVNGITQISGATTNNFSTALTYEIVSEDGTSSELWTVKAENDVTAPVITLLGNAKEQVNVGDIYKDAGAKATDNADGDISIDIVVGGQSVNTSVAGSYTLTYNVTDKAGNAATEVTRNVVVVPKTAIPTVESSKGISVYPNPSIDGYVFVKKEFTAKAAIEITDVTGRVLVKQLSSDPIIKIDIAHLQAGVYIVKISNTESNKVETIKLSVQ